MRYSFGDDSALGFEKLNLTKLDHEAHQHQHFYKHFIPMEF